MKRPEGFDHRAPVDDKPVQKRSRLVRMGPSTTRLDPPAADAPAKSAASGGAPPADTASGWRSDPRTTKIVDGLREAVWPDRSTISSHEPAARPGSAAPRDKAAEREARRAARRRRRYEKKEVRRFTRRSRRRTVAWLVAAGTAVTMGALVAIAVYSPLLELTTIEVDGTSRISAGDIHDAVDGQLGTPLALVDFDRLEDQLGDFPLIRSYVTETVPPNTLVIHVVERTPIGSIATPTGFSLVDPAGIVIERTSERIPGVPLIDTGAEEADDGAFDAAVEVLVALPDSVLSRLDTITAVTRDDVRLTLVDTGASIIWGSAENSQTKGRTLNALLANVPRASEFNVSAPGQGTYKP